MAERVVVDHKGDSHYYYTITPSPGWVFLGINTTGSFLAMPEADLYENGRAGRLTAVHFIQVDTRVVSGTNLHIQRGATDEIDGAVGFLSRALQQLGSTPSHTTDVYLLTERSSGYSFSGLADGDNVYINGFASFSPYILLHEIGHNWAAARSEVTTGEPWASFYRDHCISRYGQSAVWEYIAEAFALYHGADLGYQNRCHGHDRQLSQLPGPVQAEFNRLLRP